MRNLKLNFKYWIGFLIILIISLLAVIFYVDNDLSRQISINVLGSAIFILLFSIVFRKVWK